MPYITMCQGPKCTANGAGLIIRDMEDLAFGVACVEASGCMGQCSKGPNGMYSEKSGAKGKITNKLNKYSKLTEMLGEVIQGFGLDELQSRVHKVKFAIRREGNADTRMQAIEETLSTIDDQQKQMHPEIYAEILCLRSRELTKADPIAAYNDLREALKLLPDWPWAFVSLAQVLDNLHMPRGALASMQRAIEIGTGVDKNALTRGMVRLERKAADSKGPDVPPEGVEMDIRYVKEKSLGGEVVTKADKKGKEKGKKEKEKEAAEPQEDKGEGEKPENPEKAEKKEKKEKVSKTKDGKEVKASKAKSKSKKGAGASKKEEPNAASSSEAPDLPKSPKSPKVQETAPEPELQASLMPRDARSESHLLKTRSGVLARLGDDVKLSNLVGPSQAEKDDLALVSELRRPFDKAAEVLGKISRLRAEREQRDKDFEILQEIMGPPPSPVAPPPPDLRHRARKIPVMNFGYRHLAPGELCYFAAIGDVTTAQYLLDQAQRCGDVFFVNSTDQRSRTALHFAAHEGSTEMVQTLLEAGADSTLRDVQDRTALHVATSRGQADVARLLLGSCVYRLRTAAWHRFQQLRLQPPEPWEDPDMPIQRAARDALVEYLRALEALRRSFLLAEDKHQFTCLHYAIRDAYAGCFPILRMLLTSCFEFPEGREQDEIMRSKRFQLQPGPELVAGLCNYMQQSEAASVRQDHIRRSKVIRNEVVNHRDVEGVTPLHYAASEGNYRAVQVLLAQGADPEAAILLSKEKLKQQRAPLTAFDLAKDDLTRRTLAAGLRTGRGALAKAAVRSVESSCQNVNGSLNGVAQSPLHQVISGCDEDTSLLTKLLKDRPEIDPSVADANGWTPLHLCCDLGKASALRLLLAQAKMLHVGESGKENRPKSLGSKGSKELPSESVKSPRSPRSAEVTQVPRLPHNVGLADLQVTSMNSLMGRTPTYLAARAAGADKEGNWRSNGHICCLEVLLEMAAIDLDQPDDQGLSPLLASCSAGSLAGVVWLLRHGADCYAEDRLKHNALYIACANGANSGQIVRFLCRWDADVSRLKAMRDWKGRRPQEVYLYSQGWSRRNLPGGDERLENFATIWEAARDGDVHMLRLSLKEQGVEDISAGGWTPMMYAAKNGHVEIVRILLQMGSTCSNGGKAQRHDLKIWKGDSPLHLAAEAGHADVCSLLVRAGRASLQARNHAGLTPLHSSGVKAQLSTLKMLLALKADPQETETPMPRNIFHMLLADDREPTQCIQWLLNFLFSEEAGAEKLCKLLDHEDRAKGLQRPADLVRGRLRQVLVQALRKARQRSDEDLFSGPSSKTRSP